MKATGKSRQEPAFEYLNVVGGLLVDAGVNPLDLIGFAGHSLFGHGLGHARVDRPLAQTGNALTRELVVGRQVVTSFGLGIRLKECCN